VKLQRGSIGPAVLTIPVSLSNHINTAYSIGRTGSMAVLAISV